MSWMSCLRALTEPWMAILEISCVMRRELCAVRAALRAGDSAVAAALSFCFARFSARFLLQDLLGFGEVGKDGSCVGGAMEDSI
jgi:hypothetical protein